MAVGDTGRAVGDEHRLAAFKQHREGWQRRYQEIQREWATAQRRDVRQMLGQTAAGAYAKWLE